MLFSLIFSTLSAFTATPATAAPANPFPGYSWDVTPSPNDGPLLSADQFRFKFDLKMVRPTQYVPNGPQAFPASRGGRYSVGFFDGMTVSTVPMFYVYTDGGCCSDHVMTLNLLTGDIYDHHQHSSGPWENIPTPDLKDDTAVQNYLKALAGMTQMLQELRAPQSAINYIEQVTRAVHEHNLDIEKTLADDKVKFVSFLSVDTVTGSDITLAYSASTDRDLLIDLFTQEYDSRAGKEVQVWVGSGRVHVAAGKGTVIVPVKLAAPMPMAANTMEAVVAYAKVLPTGGSYTTALSQETATLWY